jgi:hypothetical protein
MSCQSIDTTDIILSYFDKVTAVKASKKSSNTGV